MNNYKILVINNDKFKNLKSDNKIVIKENNFIIYKKYEPYLKFIAVLLLFIIIKYKIKKLVYNKDFPTNKNDTNIKKLEKDYIFWNYTLLKNEMHSYGLYNSFKLPQISIIAMNDNISKDKDEIIKTIKSINHLNYSNVQIILSLKKVKRNSFFYSNKDIKKLKKEGILKIYEQKRNIKEDFYNLINLSKGLYTIFINSTNLLKNLSMNEIFNYSKNNINNYIKINISNYSNTFLIKSKLLKDLIDNGNEINSLNNIIEVIKSKPSPILNFIHISLCPDNNFVNLAYVTMISILCTKSTLTFICFYLIVPNNFDNKNIDFLESLHEDYDFFNITFIRMDNRYDNAYTDRRITKQAYYRFSLGELLPNLNKTIYFDTDIIVYKDLTKFFNINFNGKLILGYPSYGNKRAERRGFHRINTGVLLMNLLEMRKKNFEEKVFQIIKKRIKFRYHDQTLLNDYLKQYIGTFPPEYHTRPWSNYREMEIFNKKIGNVFDMDYFYFAHKYPTIRHFLGSYKPKNPNINYIEDWWFFARKSKYYNDHADTFKSAFSY